MAYTAKKAYLYSKPGQAKGKTAKTKAGNLVKYINGVKYYYSRKTKKWMVSKYQPKGKYVPIAHMKKAGAINRYNKARGKK